MTQPTDNGAATLAEPLLWQELIPGPDWNQFGQTDPLDPFYETEQSLLGTVSHFVAAGLDQGEVCLVVATPPHRESLEKCLRQQGVGVENARHTGQYLVMDAVETLARFMVDDLPDRGRFAELFGGILEAGRGGARVRVVGEMVALLWAKRNYAAAFHLERLWNELQAFYSFQLLCTYPMDEVEHEAALRQVCETYLHRLLTECYRTHITPEEHQRALHILQQKTTVLQSDLAKLKEVEGELKAAHAAVRYQVAELYRLYEPRIYWLSLLGFKVRLQAALAAIISMHHKITESRQ